MLTTTQNAALKAAILADAAVNTQPNNSDGNFFIAAYYNALASPAFIVWKTTVPTDEIMLNGFDWTRVDNLTVGKSRIWEWMTALGTINPSQPNVRAGVNACFSVAGADAPNRQAIYDHSSRPATRAEKLLATGTGSASNDQGVGPATMTFEGQLTGDDVESARRS